MKESNVKWFKRDRERLNTMICTRNKPKTLKQAWDKTLEKWRLLSRGFIISEDQIMSCGLCQLYFSTCYRCPIYSITGEEACENTPFRFKNGTETTSPQKAAIIELNFLIAVKKATQRKGGRK